MALLTAGYWPTTYWPSRYWVDNYWPEYGAEVIDSSLITAGYWQPKYWVKGYWPADYWPEYSVEGAIDSQQIKSGYFPDTFWPKGYWAQDYWAEYGVEVLEEVEEIEGGFLPLEFPEEYKVYSRLRLVLIAVSKASYIYVAEPILEIPFILPESKVSYLTTINSKAGMALRQKSKCSLLVDAKSDRAGFDIRDFSFSEMKIGEIDEEEELLLEIGI